MICYYVMNYVSGKLSIIILCLENAMHLGHDVAPEGQAELLDLRKQLMEDFSITPELVSKCSTEITKECDGGLHRKGEAQGRQKYHLGQKKTHNTYQCTLTILYQFFLDKTSYFM